MTLTRKKLRTGLDTGCRIVRHLQGVLPRVSIHAAAALLLTTLAACSQPDVKIQADSSAVCEAMRPAMPVLYHGKADTPDTVARIKQANARFSAACQ